MTDEKQSRKKHVSSNFFPWWGSAWLIFYAALFHNAHNFILNDLIE